jgi:hypothetical protein
MAASSDATHFPDGMLHAGNVARNASSMAAVDGALPPGDDTRSTACREAATHRQRIP